MEDIALKIVNNIWPMLIVFIVAVSLIRIFYLKSHHERFIFHKEFIYLITVIYIWLLFEILTMTEINSNSGMNIVPFSEILRYKFGTKLFYYNVFGNIIIFIPFGYLIGKYVKPKSIVPVLITTMITSTVVEFVQLKIGRSFDIDDILLNLIGGILGYLLYKLFTRIYKKLPDFLKKDFLYDLFCVIIVLLFVIYIFGYWGVIFNV